jgi:hypothetical protein
VLSFSEWNQEPWTPENSCVSSVHQLFSHHSALLISILYMCFSTL